MILISNVTVVFMPEYNFLRMQINWPHMIWDSKIKISMVWVYIVLLSAIEDQFETTSRASGEAFVYLLLNIRSSSENFFKGMIF